MKTVKDFLKHPMHFVNALLGRPNPVEIPQGQVTYQTGTQNQVQTQSVPPAKPINPDDPLHQDLAKASNLLKNLTAKLPKVSLPIAKPQTTSVPQDPNLAQISELVKPNKLKHIIPIVVFGVVILVIAIAGVAFIVPYVKNLQKPKVNPIVITQPSPTPIEQEQTKPSIYANDADILKLQEDINVLDREVVGTQLKEPTLNAPNLDFNITF
jgi:hypothetical protein